MVQGGTEQQNGQKAHTILNAMKENWGRKLIVPLLRKQRDGMRKDAMDKGKD
jgi:hypothetical protein